MKILSLVGVASLVLAVSNSASALTTDYNVANPMARGYSQYPETQIEITTNTLFVRPDGGWGDFGGPKAGEDFLVVNGATSYLPGTTTLRDFWKDALSLKADTTYRVAFDVANLFPVSPANVVLTIDGATVAGQSYLADGASGAWTPVTFTFTTGATAGKDWVGLADANLTAYGNDFVVANISVPEPATWAMMILGLGAVGVALHRRKTLAAA